MEGTEVMEVKKLVHYNQTCDPIHNMLIANHSNHTSSNP